MNLKMLFKTGANNELNGLFGCFSKCFTLIRVQFDSISRKVDQIVKSDWLIEPFQIKLFGRVRVNVHPSSIRVAVPYLTKILLDRFKIGLLTLTSIKRRRRMR